jgi:hypothetical protein
VEIEKQKLTIQQPAPPVTTNTENTPVKTHFSSLSTSHHHTNLQRFWKNATHFIVFNPENA